MKVFGCHMGTTMVLLTVSDGKSPHLYRGKLPNTTPASTPQPMGDYPLADIVDLERFEHNHETVALISVMEQALADAKR